MGWKTPHSIELCINMCQPATSGSLSNHPPPQCGDVSIFDVYVYVCFVMHVSIIHCVCGAYILDACIYYPLQCVYTWSLEQWLIVGVHFVAIRCNSFDIFWTRPDTCVHGLLTKWLVIKLWYCDGVRLEVVGGVDIVVYMDGGYTVATLVYITPPSSHHHATSHHSTSLSTTPHHSTDPTSSHYPTPHHSTSITIGLLSITTNWSLITDRWSNILFIILRWIVILHCGG